MKLSGIITYTLGFAPTLALANVNFVTTVQALPGKQVAVRLFLGAF
jgi:hypothetical protein